MINKAVVKKIHGISPVWIVPIVALAIAIWIAVQARIEKGTEIQITFAQASDIIAGQTLIKLKNVEVGKVKSLRLSPDLKSVVVTAELDSSVSSHLSENTRFWVVTPRISTAGVSNLGTLISGVYILMDPGEKGRRRTKFEGLNESPAFESDEPGTQYVLQAEELGRLQIGSPIYFRQIRVGEITGYNLSKNSEAVDVHIFIRAPHDEIVTERSRFWNVSGFGVSVNASGIKARMESLVSLINGGIAFDNAADYEKSKQADPTHRFYLHPDRESVLEGQFDIEYFYVLKFSGSLRGLSVGAPVEFRGIKVGEVVDIKLANSDNTDKNLYVYISMEPQRLEPNTSPSREEVDEKMDGMIKQGLRGQMKVASLITGSRFIDLAFFDDNSDAALIRGKNYSEIPTITDDSIDLITKQVSEVLTKVNAIPIDQIGNDLAGSMASLNKILSTLEKENTAGKVDGAVANLEQTLQAANQALQQMADTMKTVDQAIAPDSELKYELNDMLKSVGDAAKSLELFMNELNRHPNSLISGAKKDE
ncbi:intermembrane transport protein PqiB [Agarilytica rhodophyticola]|uniref:PqiB family protein n=1 Tax=Agarilytica rhodophyticola TaxID=1737490 RepID=UPI000B341392|nr:MlaD family protein [Agarilytica rhodophyticola]